MNAQSCTRNASEAASWRCGDVMSQRERKEKRREEKGGEDQRGNRSEGAHDRIREERERERSIDRWRGKANHPMQETLLRPTLLLNEAVDCDHPCAHAFQKSLERVTWCATRSKNRRQMHRLALKFRACKLRPCGVGCACCAWRVHQGADAARRPPDSTRDLERRVHRDDAPRFEWNGLIIKKKTR